MLTTHEMGIIFDSELTYNFHTNRKINKTCPFMCLRLVYPNMFVDKDKSVKRSPTDYAKNIWFP